ncbi:hypothetical protein NL64_06425 [Pseudomonas fluorescens]|uniref:antirestriction protein n=1 Tax=Pseudomonas fluorescens TaxID=294 RepID=UPI00054B7D49|nr:antirestriction protein [Pseudomonas fluorescens]KII34889.1 hypothetical protein NL64_06425 [Pseudomonas fluorescens]
MKTFTPNDSDAMCDATNGIFRTLAIAAEGYVFHTAGKNSDEYRGGSWAFTTNDNDTLGFWYPLDQATYPVACENYYENLAMDAKSFGAACTLIAINRLAWKFHEAGQPALSKEASNLYHALRNWIFDLGEGDTPFINSAAVAGFID